jgi:hypothetical protein
MPSSLRDVKQHLHHNGSAEREQQSDGHRHDSDLEESPEADVELLLA